MTYYSKKEDSPSSSQPLSSVLFSKIQKDILSGAIKAGDKLTEQKICDRYDVSRTPVREALRQLETEGLIENIPNRGAFVLGFTIQDMKDLFDLMTLYELQAVTWAVKRMTDSEIEILEETFDFMEFYTMKHDVNKMASINRNFHHSIYAGSHNRMLIRTLTSYQLYIQYADSKVPNQDPSVLDVLLDEHRAIFNAIVSRDETAAYEAMKTHMDNSKERFIKSL